MRPGAGKKEATARALARVCRRRQNFGRAAHVCAGKEVALVALEPRSEVACNRDFLRFLSPVTGCAFVYLLGFSVSLFSTGRSFCLYTLRARNLAEKCGLTRYSLNNEIKDEAEVLLRDILAVITYCGLGSFFFFPCRALPRSTRSTITARLCKGAALRESALYFSGNRRARL